MSHSNIISITDENHQTVMTESSPKFKKQTPSTRSATFYTRNSKKRLIKLIENKTQKSQSNNLSLEADELALINTTLPKVNQKQEIDIQKRLVKVLRNNDGRDISNLINAQNLRPLTNSTQTLTNFYHSKKSNIKNNFYAQLTIPIDPSEHNIFNQGLRDSNSLSDLTSDLQVSENFMRNSQKKFHKLDVSEYIQKKIQSDVGQFMKARKEITNLYAWIQQQFQKLNDEQMPIKAFLDKKINVVGSVFDELVMQVGRDCKERGQLLQELLKMITDLYHGAYKALQDENAQTHANELSQQVTLHQVYQKKLDDLMKELEDLRAEMVIQSEIADNVVKDDVYLRKKNKKFERLLNQLNYDLGISQKEYGDVYKENLRLLMKFYEVDEQHAQELKRQYRSINDIKSKQVNLEVIDAKLKLSVQQQFENKLPFASVEHYIQLQEDDDMSESDHEVVVAIRELVDVGVDTEDLFHYSTIAVDTQGLIMIEDESTQYTFTHEMISIGIQDNLEMTSVFTNTHTQTKDIDTQTHLNHKSQSTQTQVGDLIEVPYSRPQMNNSARSEQSQDSIDAQEEEQKQQEEEQKQQEELQQKQEELQQKQAADEAEVQKKRKLSIKVIEQDGIYEDGRVSPTQSRIRFEDDYSKLDDRYTLMNRNTQSILQMTQKQTLSTEETLLVQTLTKANQTLLQELFKQSLSTLRQQKKSSIHNSEALIKISEKNSQIQSQQAALQFLRNDIAQLQELTETMDPQSRLRCERLIAGELRKLPLFQERFIDESRGPHNTNQRERQPRELSQILTANRDASTKPRERQPREPSQIMTANRVASTNPRERQLREPSQIMTANRDASMHEPSRNDTLSGLQIPNRIPLRESSYYTSSSIEQQKKSVRPRLSNPSINSKDLSVSKEKLPQMHYQNNIQKSRREVDNPEVLEDLRLQGLKKSNVKSTQVLGFNFDKKKSHKQMLQAEHQTRASQLLLESIQSYHPSQHVAKNRKKILATLIKNIQPLFNDMFRMIRKQEEFKFPIHVFLYTVFIFKFGLMKVSEKNFTQNIHHLYQCQDYAPWLIFFVQLLGLNLPLEFLKQIPQDKNIFCDMLSTHGYIHFLIFKWLTLISDNNGNQNLALDLMQTNTTRLLEFLNKFLIPDMDAHNIIHRMRDIMDLSAEENVLSHKFTLRQTTTEYQNLNLFTVGSALYNLILEEYNTYSENVQYIFGALIDRNIITFLDFKTFIDSLDSSRKRSSSYMELLQGFLTHSDTVDDIEGQCSMTMQKLTAFCWMNKVFSPTVVSSIKEQLRKMNSTKVTVEIARSFKWFLLQHKCVTSTYQKLQSYIQIHSGDREGAPDIHHKLQLCQYIMLTKIEEIQSSEISNQFLPSAFHQILDGFNRTLIQKSKQ